MLGLLQSFYYVQGTWKERARVVSIYVHPKVRMIIKLLSFQRGFLSRYPKTQPKRKSPMQVWPLQLFLTWRYCPGKLALREGELSGGTINLKGTLLDAAWGRAAHATSICIRRSLNNQIPVVLIVENLTARKAKGLSQEAVLTLIDNILNTACHNCALDL